MRGSGLGWGGGHQLLVVQESFTEDAMLRADLQSPHGKEHLRYREEQIPSKAQDCWVLRCPKARHQTRTGLGATSLLAPPPGHLLQAPGPLSRAPGFSQLLGSTESSGVESSQSWSWWCPAFIHSLTCSLSHPYTCGFSHLLDPSQGTTLQPGRPVQPLTLLPLLPGLVPSEL